MPSAAPSPATLDPLWYKNGVIYQAHVRSFLDSDGNGVGDFQGFTQKLDYLQDLGVSAIWLLPFYPSPLKDEGYDIADYTSVNPLYGTLDDFREFLNQAHKRGLRVITELVVNHTSDQHPWFQQSRRAKPGSKWRDFYVWSDSPDRYREARVIFPDFEPSNWTWDPVAGAYFWHRFYSHQPDLNFDNPAVHEEIVRVLDFWLEMGVDGLRLDAVPYLYEREGTSCENLEETHAFLRKLRAHVDGRYRERVLLAEANQWPEDAVQYFGKGRGDECHMAFHFPLMPRLFMAVRMEDRVPIVDILEQTPDIPETCQWAIFLRNHDELSLEMVTEDERDYMYRMYATDSRARINLGIRRRLAPLLNNDRRRIELLNALLLSMPGTPVIYYGDEIGMGDNIYLGDRNGVRTPMHWSSDKNAGFSRANPQSLYLPIILDPEYHYEAVNVEAQLLNSSSLLWWTRRILALRQRWAALGRGTVRFLHPDNRKILAFVREHGSERVLIVANLSRYAQSVDLDLSAYDGAIPVELFGRTRFPAVAPGPYKLSLSPHGFYWFSLEPAVTPAEAARLPQSHADLPLLSLDSEREALGDLQRSKLASILPGYLVERRWFGGKARELRGITLIDIVPIPAGSGQAYLTLFNADYVQGDPEPYLLPVAYCDPSRADALIRERPEAAIARVRDASGTEGLLIDALADKGFAQALLDAVREGKIFRGASGQLAAVPAPAFPALRGDAAALEPAIARAEQSNTAVIYGDRLILKVFRRPEVGINPDVETSRFLAERSFPHVPPLAGTLEYRTRTETRSIGILHGFVTNAKDAWSFTVDALGRYYERVQLYLAEQRPCPLSPASLLELAAAERTPQETEALGTYLESARLLGLRTAELHLALASGEAGAFAPEPFTPFYQRSLYQSMRNLLIENFQLLERQMPSLPESVRADAQAVLGLKGHILLRYKAVCAPGMQAVRMRCHGDYHLGQLLHTGKDFVILDFEGEPARSLSVRRLKRSPVSDLAGMLRSFHYAASVALDHAQERGQVTAEVRQRVAPWAAFWAQAVGAAYLRAYLDAVAPGRLLPSRPDHLQVLLEAYLLDKAVYEIGYELNNRPAWLRIPFDGVLQLVSPAPVAQPVPAPVPTTPERAPITAP